MKAAIKDGASVHELPLQDIRARIVESNALIIKNKKEHAFKEETRQKSIIMKLGFSATYAIPRGDEKVIAVVGESEVGDAVGGRVGELSPVAAGQSRVHGDQLSRDRRINVWI